jgi:hypothetical protein
MRGQVSEEFEVEEVEIELFGRGLHLLEHGVNQQANRDGGNILEKIIEV